jgi:DNA-binding CsgD family transcriptional regulator
MARASPQCDSYCNTKNKSRGVKVEQSVTGAASVHDAPPRVGLSEGLASKLPDIAPRLNTVDSYDQDLTWIVDKLAHRMGCDFGVICRFLALETGGTAIAVGAGYPQAAPQFLRDVIATAGNGRTDADTSDAEQVRMMEQPMGEGDDSYQCLSMSFYPSRSVNIVAAVFRKDRTVPFSPLQHGVAMMFYPVLSRYVRLWWMHREERSRAAAFKSALDISDVGVILLDRKLELVFENARARALLERRCGIRREGKFVVAEVYNDGMKLQASLQHSLHYNLAQPRPPGRQSAPLLSLRRTDGERPLIVTVLGLEKMAMDARDAAVILHIIDPGRDFSLLIAPLCSTYSLTKVETRLVYLLITGMNLATAAETMKVQEASARSYLKQIFIKTFTNRQADLVRLMLCSLQHINPSVELDPQ